MWTLTKGLGWRICCFGLGLLVPLATAPRLAAQDSQYWSVQYGPVAQLVGGQVIGGVPDLSASFYNPGALALRNESSYLLSTESFQLESISTKGSEGAALFDTSSSGFGAAPSLIAGSLPKWLGSETRLAWSFLTRQKMDTRLGQRLTNPLGAPFIASAAESYLDQRLTENWGGLTLSRPVGKTMGLGVTLYGVYRGQRTRKELSAQAIAADGRALAVSSVRDYDYSNYRALAKLGFAWQRELWNAGVSVTTPSLGVLGSGSAGYTRSASGVDSTGAARPTSPILITATAEDLDATYRTSWAVGTGGSVRRGATRVYVSAEWFAPVEKADVLALPATFGEDVRLTQEARSVLNAGLGVEQVLSEDLSVYGAFHTDFSSSLGGSPTNVAVSDWNLYHLSGGTSFRILDNRFTLGAMWAFGSRPRAVDSALSEGNATSLGAPVEVSYSRITFLLGFVFGR